MAFLAKQVFRNYWSQETRPKPIPKKHSSNLNNYGIMQNKRNVCTDQRILGKAFFEMFLFIPTQSEQLFRVLLIKTMKMK